MNKIALEIISDPKECERLWRKCIKPRSVFDLWDVRYSFQQAFKNKLQFHLFKQMNGVVGLIPLWYSADKKIYECIGGEWCEDNAFFSQSTAVLREIIKALPKPLSIKSISAESLKKTQELFKEDEMQYFLSLVGKKTIADFTKNFSKKHRYNFIRDYRKIAQTNPTMRWINNTEEQLKYLEKMKRLSIKRFEDKKEESTFLHKNDFDSYTYLIKNQGEYRVRMLAIEMDTKTVSIEFILLFKKTYYVVTGASDISAYPGIGNHNIYVLIEDALSSGSYEINILQEDHGWKHRYFSERKMMKLEK